MAKAEGTQSIPAEWLDIYRATLGEQKDDGVVEKRYPFRVPTAQAGKAGETVARKAQRTNFLAAVAKFNLLSPADRQRWYARMPPWSSLLWYYNWFMLNAIPNLWQAVPGGDAILNSIKHYPFTLPIGAPALVTVDITTVDPTKSIVMFQGAAGLEVGPNSEGLGVIYPMLFSLSSTQVVMKASMQVSVAGLCSVTVIEYI